MRALPFLAAILFTTPFAGAKTELELLQDRCHEQERQIRQLEGENGRLKSLMTTAASTPAPVQAEAKKEDATTSTKEDAGTFGIVRNGDTLRKLAKRHGTTPDSLAKLNNLKSPFLIRAGQKLRLPEKTTGVQAAAAERPAAAVRGTHQVKKGETLFSIARHYGMGPEAIQDANPGVKASSLKIGQTLKLGVNPAAAPAPVTKTASNKSVAAKEISTKPVAKEASYKPVAKLAESKPKVTEETKTAASETPEPSASQAVTNAPRIRSISIDNETDFAAFAAAHGTSTAKLNALNGLNLTSGTVLAKGSELYVPAQP